MQDETFSLFDKAIKGDKQALEKLILSVEDLIYNLSLRMLGTIYDAQDATQEIIIRVITQLSTFRKESAFSTWVYRIATNYLINYKKSMFAQRPLNFEFYRADIEVGFIENTQDLLQNVNEQLLADELKMSCTNVMLQCLDPESRCIYILGVMFKINSKICGDILGITSEGYRQRLSRIRKKMGDFLSAYCGLSKQGSCNCRKRVGYAIQTKRLNPQNLEYSKLNKMDDSISLVFTQTMEKMDELSLVFAELPRYRSSETIKDFLQRLLKSDNMSIIKTEL